MSIRIASHLFRNRHGTFYFRLVVPKDLRAFVNQREIRFSLHTEQRQQATAYALSLIVNLPNHILELRRMAESNDNPITDSHHAMWLQQLRDNLYIKSQNAELELRVAELELQLKKSVPRLRAQAVVTHALTAGRLGGKRELEKHLAFPWPPERTVLFSELQAAYMKSLTVRATGGTKKPPNPKSMEEYVSSIQFFITVMGDLRIGEIDREIAGDYFLTLKKLPPNLSRLSKYRGKSIPELIAMGDSPQSEVNVSKKIERIGVH